MQTENLKIIECESASSSQSEHFLQSEKNLLREALLRTHQERFLFATQLYKIQKTMEKFSIVHKPYYLNK
jgi:hypothetical protein